MLPWMSRYFGMQELAKRTVQAILAFMPSVPNLAYNGAALGIGDFSNNAKLTPYGGWERPLQHYRSGVSLTLLSECACADDGVSEHSEHVSDGPGVAF